MDGHATIAELCLIGGLPSARIRCKETLVPTPGRYALVRPQGSDAPLATEVFAASYQREGFVAAVPIPRDWIAGMELDIRGPLGKGFELPTTASRVALMALAPDLTRLLPVMDEAVRRHAAVAVVFEGVPVEIPLQVEVHPRAALAEVMDWCDYAAIDVEVDSAAEMLQSLTARRLSKAPAPAQALIRVPMPCGGIAACGVCTINTARGPKLACADGPVFDLSLLRVEG